MAELKVAPVLSTPAEAIFEFEPLGDAAAAAGSLAPRTDDELRDVYEVARTVREIRAAGWTCVALQFPDTMLGDAPRAVRLLQQEWARGGNYPDGSAEAAAATPPPRFYILADTSYSACCVDEVAAEHAGADVVVHYGRSCLSPTSRLPVVYVFTKHPLDADAVVAALVREFPDPTSSSARIVLMADVAYQDHVPAIFARLQARGYARVLATTVVHRPLGRIPNRRIVDATGNAVEDVEQDDGDHAGDHAVDGNDPFDLRGYAIFHIAQPPTSLLLALAVRVRAFFVYPTPTKDNASDDASPLLLAPRTMGLLGRRYAKVLSMATAGIIGILVNTLSVRDYLAAVNALRDRIAAAGKKSYLIVVGKLNPAKLANFAEIDGWVVVGCWESSLVEDDAGFYRPVVTPFELELALTSDDERVWGVRWWGGLEGLAEGQARAKEDDKEEDHNNDDEDDEENDIPQFDLRTGRLVTTSRPMRGRGRRAKAEAGAGAGAEAGGDDSGHGQGPLALRQTSGALASIRGVVSPGAEYLRSQRTWQGLGTDFNDPDADPPSTALEQGRSGIARGYTLDDDNKRT